VVKVVERRGRPSRSKGLRDASRNLDTRNPTATRGRRSSPQPGITLWRNYMPVVLHRYVHSCGRNFTEK
jgi:hypothetical protein